MTRNVVGWVAEYLGLAGFALLLRSSSEDDRHFIIAFADRATGLTLCVTALGVGAVLLSRPHERRAVPLIILATVLMDAVLLSHGLGVTGLWHVPVFVVVALLAVPAALLSGVNRRQRIAYGVLVGVGVTTVLILAVVVLVTPHDAPFF
ncbi:MAG: hypothetical protein ABWX92_11740 [Mycetocola sp.]